MQLIHYAESPLTQAHSRKQQVEQLKPEGLWCSVSSAWADWCRTEEFQVHSLRYAHEIIVTPDANLLHLRGAEAIDIFTTQYEMAPLIDHAHKRATSLRWIDWRRVAEDYGGIVIDPYCWRGDIRRTRFGTTAGTAPRPVFGMRSSLQTFASCNRTSNYRSCEDINRQGRARMKSVKKETLKYIGYTVGQEDGSHLSAKQRRQAFDKVIRQLERWRDDDALQTVQVRVEGGGIDLLKNIKLNGTCTILIKVNAGARDN